MKFTVWELEKQRARRFGVLIVCSLATLCVCGTLPTRGEKLRVRWAGAIRVNSPQGITLEDVDPQGRVLLTDSDATLENPSLLLWNPAKKDFDRRIRPDWELASVPRWIPATDRGPRSFKVVDNSGDIVGVEGYYLIVIDGRRGTFRRVLCAPDLDDRSSPYLDERQGAWSYVNGAVLARHKYTGLIAVAFNFGKWPRVFLLRAEWNVPYASWRMDRFVKDLAWSPDGNTVAVLYSGAFGNDLKNSVPLHRGQPQSTLPDVALVDAKTGKIRLKFFSGDRQSSIIFSPDGKFIYCASWYPIPPARGWAVREFSVLDGKLVRKFEKSRVELKGNLVLSPDGRFLVTDANSTRRSLGLIWNDVYGYDRRFRFVILDTATGEVAFEHEEKTHNTLLWLPPTFAFSPDGKFLYVDPRVEGYGSPQIDVYSLAHAK